MSHPKSKIISQIEHTEYRILYHLPERQVSPAGVTKANSRSPPSLKLRWTKERLFAFTSSICYPLPTLPSQLIKPIPLYKSQLTSK